jgi:hypothetical protein
MPLKIWSEATEELDSALAKLTGETTSKGPGSQMNHASRSSVPDYEGLLADVVHVINEARRAAARVRCGSGDHILALAPNRGNEIS